MSAGGVQACDNKNIENCEVVTVSSSYAERSRRVGKRFSEEVLKNYWNPFEPAMDLQRRVSHVSGSWLPIFFEASQSVFETSRSAATGVWSLVAPETLTPKLAERAKRQQELLQRQAIDSWIESRSRYMEAVAAHHRSVAEATGRVAEAQRSIQDAVADQQRNMQAAADRIAEAQRSYQEALADRQEWIARATLDSVAPMLSTSPELSTRESAVSEYTATSDPESAMRLIDELLAEDPTYDQDTWPEIAEALDRDRLSDRKLFID